MFRLAKDIGFESKMFPVEFKFNSKEPLRYYLWMFELYKWLVDNKMEELRQNNFTYHFTLEVAPDLIEYVLIEVLKILLKEK